MNQLKDLLVQQIQREAPLAGSMSCIESAEDPVTLSRLQRVAAMVGLRVTVQAVLGGRQGR